MDIQIRGATESDSKMIFAWRNDPVTISTSRSGAELKWEILLERFHNPETTWIIGECDSEPFGVVWLKHGRSGILETSVILSPDFRGKKLSAPLLSTCLDLMRITKGAAFFSTEIKDTNLASIKMFGRCGFVYVHPTPAGFGIYCTGLPCRIAV